MMELIYKKKMAYFESGGDEDWKTILERTYPKEAPIVTPPKYNKEQERAHNAPKKSIGKSMQCSLIGI